jgi:chromate transporter
MRRGRCIGWETILAGLWQLGRTAVKDKFLGALGILSLALMAMVTWRLGRDSVIDLPTALLVLGSAVLLVRFRLNSLWLVLGGALIGWLVCALKIYVV